METAYLVTTFVMIIPMAIELVSVISVFFKHNNNKSSYKWAAISSGILGIISIPRLIFAINSGKEMIGIHILLIAIWFGACFFHFMAYNELK